MKKKMIALIAGLMLTLSAGSAFAYYGNGDLTEVIFDSTANKEYMLDLGTLSLVNGNYVLTPSAAPLSVSGATLGFTAGATTQVSFYGLDNTNANGLVSYNASAQPVAGGPLTFLQSAIGTMKNNTYTGGPAMGTSMTNVGSFNVNMRAGDGTIAFGSFLDNSAADGSWEQNLSLTTLATEGIYRLKGDGLSGTLEFLANVSIDANGNVVTTLINQNAPATPIPAAIYLMGSGLLGMFGLRRKQRG